MKSAIGKTTWVIPDMYWPEVTSGETYVSHEAICAVNTSDAPAHLEVTLLYEDGDPVTGLEFTCGAMRTHHIRMDKAADSGGRPLRRGVPYAAVVQSDVPIVVQYTRVDTTQKELALMSTMAYGL